MPKNTDILSAAEIQNFTKKLQATLAAAERGFALQQLVAGFGGAALPKAVAAPAGKVAAKAPKAAGKVKKTRKPGMDPEKVLAALKGLKDGLSLAALATKVGEKNKDRVASALRKLRDDKKATVKGERRLAKWFAA